MIYKLRLTGLNRLVVLLIFLLLSIGAQAEMLYVVNSQSRTLSRIDTVSDAVNNSFASLGNTPNKVVVDEDYLWVVCSGDNAVQKLSRSDGSLVANVFIGMSSNPWDAVLHEGYLYVSGLFTGKVYKVDTNSNSVVASVNVGYAPEGLCVFGDKLYVANAGNYMQNYAGSSVSVIALDSFTTEGTIPVSANPQYLSVHNRKIHVSCTGNWADIGGAVCVIDPLSNSVVETIPLGGTPGCLWMAGDELAYVGDSNGAVMYSYNPTAFSVLHGAENPLAMGASEIVGNASFIALLSPVWGSNGIVKLVHPDLSHWKQYTVALMPTDMKLYSPSSANEDLVVSAKPLNLYPNPVRKGTTLKFSGTDATGGELSLYNLKGQLVHHQSFEGTELQLPELQLAAGVYLYQVQSLNGKGTSYKGKLVLRR